MLTAEAASAHLGRGHPAPPRTPARLDVGMLIRP